jgi:S1-C subfamily serine protease
MQRDTSEWQRPWVLDDEPDRVVVVGGPATASAGDDRPQVFPGALEEPSGVPRPAPFEAERPASPQPPPPGFGESDAGPGSPVGSIRPPDTIGTVEPPPARTTRRGFSAGLVGALVGAVLGTAGTLAIVRTTPAYQVAPGTGSTAPLVQVEGDGGIGVVTAVAAAVTPSVVRIDVLQASTDEDAPEGTTEQAGLGSGVVYRADGYIITNNHVVETADQLRVRFADGEASDAEVIGTDPLTDLAVLKVDRQDLPAINVRTDAAVVGETAIAIGSPFGLDASVTAGVVSALNRELEVPPQQGRGGLVIPAVVQTDAAINPGNSGGALVDAEGRLLGINTAILTASGGSQGVGFAVSSTAAVSAADQLIDQGFVSHAFLGVGGIDVGPEFTARYERRHDVELEGGTLVEQVEDDSGAQAAGIEVGDVIVRVDDTEILNVNELIVAIRGYAPGDRITVTYYRDGERRQAEVTLGERPR